MDFEHTYYQAWQRWLPNRDQVALALALAPRDADRLGSYAGFGSAGLFGARSALGLGDNAKKLHLFLISAVPQQFRWNVS